MKNPLKSVSVNRITGSFLPPLLAVLVGFTVGAIAISAVGIDPLSSYFYFINSTLGSLRGFGQCIVKATPILLIAAGLIVPFTSHLWNIGIDGQVWMGAVTTAWLALTLGDLPNYVVIPVLFIAGFLAGGFWGLIPAILEAKLKVNLVITSLMLNYVAIFFTNYLLKGPLENPDVPGLSETAPLPPSARLPLLVPDIKLHIGIIVAVLCAVLVYILVFRTTLGYEMRLVGSGPEAARYAGVNRTKIVVLSMVLSGGMCGLAGLSEVAGNYYWLGAKGSHRILDFMGQGIMATMLGNVHPFGAVLSSLFIGVMYIGGDAMRFRTGVPYTIVDIITSVMLLFVICREFFAIRRISLREYAGKLFRRIARS